MTAAVAIPLLISLLIIVFGGGFVVGLAVCSRRIVRAAKEGRYLTLKEALAVRRHAQKIIDAVDKAGEKP